MPIDFTFTKEQVALKMQVREFVDTVAKPIADEIDRTRRFPHEIINGLADMGLLCPVVPKEWGGSGLSYVDYAIIAEEVGRGDAGAATVMGAICSLTAVPILMYGTQDQKERYLPKLARGEWVGAFALTEPQAGSDSGKTLVSIKPLDEAGTRYAVNGHKIWTTNGDMADLILVFCTSDPSKGVAGITPVLVERTMKGFSSGRIEETVGIHGSHQVDTFYEDVEIGEEQILGGKAYIGKGFRVAMGTLDGGRVGVAAVSCGIAQQALDEAIEHAKTREQFGKPIAENQSISFRLADMATRLHAARLMTYHAAWMKDMNIPNTYQSAQAKLYASEAAWWITDQALQIFGGWGYTRTYPAERHLRDARIKLIYEGTSEIQRLVISRTLLKQGAYDFGITFNPLEEEAQKELAGVAG
ncbi:MAG TPA: acyl-CoA dehydrogenase family protein [bacterium]|nr:acyl-CoA dehydrogenase family protein [bacterium]